MTKQTSKRPANVDCAVCGKPVATCTVPGLHGMLRDRARSAADQIAAR